MDNSNRLCFCHAISGFKFKQLDFRCFKKSLSKTAVIASFIVQMLFSTNLMPYIPFMTNA